MLFQATPHGIYERADSLRRVQRVPNASTTSGARKTPHAGVTDEKGASSSDAGRTCRLDPRQRRQQLKVQHTMMAVVGRRIRSTVIKVSVLEAAIFVGGGPNVGEAGRIINAATPVSLPKLVEFSPLVVLVVLVNVPVVLVPLSVDVLVLVVEELVLVLDDVAVLVEDRVLVLIVVVAVSVVVLVVEVLVLVVEEIVLVVEELVFVVDVVVVAGTSNTV
mmetsp:Transcript_20929/g.60410  ORF Transcript_20929/g.60410 Transcript_20929/m.60410 type:complete len:219 (+) Transcript_20929:11-667(+)